MDDALSKLTPEQKQMIMAKAQQEANQQVMQQMMDMMNKTCFDKCVGTTVRPVDMACCFLNVFGITHICTFFLFQGDRLDSKEQACLASCQDRYFDARSAVQEAIQKRQNTGM